MEGMSRNFPVYSPSGVWSEEQNRLAYQWYRGKVEIDKNREKLNQRLAYEEKSHTLKMCRDAFKELLGAEVYKNMEGVLVYTVTDPNGKSILSRRLLNVEAYEPRMLISAKPTTMALEITWGKTEGHTIYFTDAENGIPIEVFGRRLKTRGVEFLVSGRTEKKAVAALLAYTYRVAPLVYIPLYHGWCQNERGEWHYASDDEMTMQEVRANV